MRGGKAKEWNGFGSLGTGLSSSPQRQREDPCAHLMDVFSDDGHMGSDLWTNSDIYACSSSAKRVFFQRRPPPRSCPQRRWLPVLSSPLTTAYLSAPRGARPLGGTP